MNIAFYTLLALGLLSIVHGLVALFAGAWELPRDPAVRQAWSNVALVILLLGADCICVALILATLNMGWLLMILGAIGGAVLVNAIRLIRRGGFRPQRPQHPATPHS